MCAGIRSPTGGRRRAAGPLFDKLEAARLSRHGGGLGTGTLICLPFKLAAASKRRRFPHQLRQIHVWRNEVEGDNDVATCQLAGLLRIVSSTVPPRERIAIRMTPLTLHGGGCARTRARLATTPPAARRALIFNAYWLRPHEAVATAAEPLRTAKQQSAKSIAAAATTTHLRPINGIRPIIAVRGVSTESSPYGDDVHLVATGPERCRRSDGARRSLLEPRGTRWRHVGQRSPRRLRRERRRWSGHRSGRRPRRPASGRL